MSRIILDENHRYWLGKEIIPGVNEVLNAEGFQNLNCVPEAILEAGRKFGTAVHKACELEDRKNLATSSLSHPLIPYLEDWVGFKKSFGIKNFEAIEFTGYSKTYKFGFTLDRVFVDSKKRILLEIKTGQEQAAAEIQTAAYQIGYEEQTRRKTHERWAVYLTGNGYKIKPHKSPTDKSIFLNALTCYKWKKGKGLI